MAQASSTMLNSSGESGHPCLVPDLSGKALSFCPLSMMLAKKLLDLINEFGKIAGYKVNTQKSKEFWYTNNKTLETEIGKKSHLI